MQQNRPFTLLCTGWPTLLISNRHLTSFINSQLHTVHRHEGFITSELPVRKHICGGRFTSVMLS